MSEEDFLKRWSRRKREAAKPDQPATETEVAREAAPDRAAPDKHVSAPQPEFDPSSLPPIESITALSDVTAFLRAGVPMELTRAALRRAWTADPAIRDFVGLAENAWDFTDPNAIPGFGPLESSEEVRRMIAQVVDQIGQAAEPAVESGGRTGREALPGSNDSNEIRPPDRDNVDSRPVASTDDAKKDDAQVLSTQVLLQSNTQDIAMQHDAAEAKENPKQLSRRGHGRALPR